MHVFYITEAHLVKINNKTKHMHLLSQLPDQHHQQLHDVGLNSGQLQCDLP